MNQIEWTSVEHKLHNISRSERMDQIESDRMDIYILQLAQVERRVESTDKMKTIIALILKFFMLFRYKKI